MMEMLDPPANTRLHIWGEYATTELDMMNPPDTVNQARVKMRIYGKYLTSKHKVQTAKNDKNHEEKRRY